MKCGFNKEHCGKCSHFIHEEKYHEGEQVADGICELDGSWNQSYGTCDKFEGDLEYEFDKFR